MRPASRPALPSPIPSSCCLASRRSSTCRSPGRAGSTCSRRQACAACSPPCTARPAGSRRTAMSSSTSGTRRRREGDGRRDGHHRRRPEAWLEAHVGHGLAVADRHLHAGADQGQPRRSQAPEAAVPDPCSTVRGRVPRDHAPARHDADRVAAVARRALAALDHRHGIFLDHHSSAHWPRTHDLEMLVESGTTVAHCPIVFQRRGIAMQSFGGYVAAGLISASARTPTRTTCWRRCAPSPSARA